MKRWLGMTRLLAGIGLEMGPGIVVTFAAVSIAGPVGSLVFALGLRPLVDGLVGHRPAQVAVGALVCALALLALIAAPVAATRVHPRIRDGSIMVMQRRLLRLSTTAPYLDHFERPDFWNRLRLLQNSFGALLQSMAYVLVGPAIVIQLIVTAAVLAGLQPVLLLLPLAALPAMWLNRSGERLKRAAEERVAEPRRGIDHLFMLASSAQPAKEVRIYGLGPELLARHYDLAEGVEGTTESALFRSAALGILGWLIFALAYTGAVVLTLQAAAGGRLTPGDVALTLTLATSLVMAAGGLASIAENLLQAVTVADHYTWLAEHVAAGSRNRARTPPAAVPARVREGFELRRVSFRYPGGDRWALENVSLRLPAGAVVALVGENGAGKTTLVKLLARMYAPTEGRIVLDGLDIDKFDVGEYRQRLAAGFQDFVRFELAAGEAVGIGDVPRLAEEAAVRGALGRAGAEFVERLPAGLGTQLGPAWEGGVDLSGGEWQKVALARAMMRDDPLLLVFDEPTSSLDPQTEHALFERVAAGARAGATAGRVTLLVSHRFSTVRMADLIVVLQGGRVLDQGSHAELMARGGLYAELYGLQERAYGDAR